MAASVTLSATTIEGQLYELLERMINLQNVTANNPDQLENITGTGDSQARRNTYTVIVDYEVSIGTQGQIVNTAKAWLS